MIQLRTCFITLVKSYQIVYDISKTHKVIYFRIVYAERLFAMQKLNTKIILEKIQSLMERDGYNQSQLADKLGMTQPNFNRAFNNKNGQFFTLEQMYKISQVFNVSIDYLIGVEKPTPTSTEKEICLLFTSLLKQRKLVKMEISRKEDIYTPFSMYDHYPELHREQHTIAYPAFVFPNFFDVGPLDRYTEEQIDNLQSDLYYNGNQDESNMRINHFFERYLKIYDMYLHNQMDEDLFDEIVSKFLADLS